MADLKEFTTIPITQEDIDSLVQAAGPDQDPTTILAQELSKQFTDNEGLSYEALSGGTSPYLQALNRKSLNDEQIVQFLATNPDGTEIQTGFSRALEGAKREVLPTVGSIPAAKAGFAGGLKAQTAIPVLPPPFTPVSVIAKAGLPVVTSLLGGIFGYDLTKAAQDEVIGDEGVVLADDKAAVVAGKTLVNVGGPLSGLRVISKKSVEGGIDFGGAAYTKNLEDKRQQAIALRDELSRGGPSISAVRGRRGARTSQEAADQVKIPKDKTALSRTVNYIEKQFKNAPDTTYSSQIIPVGSAAIGSGTGGYIAENLDPDNEVLRFGLELGGGTASGLVPNLIGAVVNKSVIGELVQKLSFTQEALRKKGVNIILEDLQASDDPLDNVDTILKLLRNPEFDKIVGELGENVDTDVSHLRSVVLRTNSPVLKGHEIALDNATGSNLGAETQKQGQEFFNLYRDRIIALARTGDSAALQIAADLMKANFEAGFQARLQAATDAQLAAFERLSPDADRTQASAKFAETSLNLMKQARAQERKIYDSLQDAELNVKELADAGLLARTGDPDNPSPVEMLDDFLEEFEGLDPGVEEAATENLKPLLKYAKDLRKRLVGEAQEADPETGITPPPVFDPDDALTLQGFFKNRGVFLNKMRDLQADPTKKSAARNYGEFSELLLDIVEQLPFSKQSKSEQKLARAYSRALNDTFTRAFTGRISERTRIGSRRRPPELLHKDLFAGGADALGVRLSEFDQIADFFKKQGIDTSYTDSQGRVLNGVTDAQDLLNRLIRNELGTKFDSVTGEISPAALEKFNKDYGVILDRPEFAEIKGSLADAGEAKRLLESVKAEQLADEKRLRKLVTFQQLSSNATESPSSTINAAIGSSSQTPMKNLNSLLGVVNNPDLTPEQREEAMAGFQHAFLDWAVGTAGGYTLKEGNVSNFKPSKMFQTLFTPIPRAQNNQQLITVKPKPKKNKTDLDEFEYGGWLVENEVFDENLADRVHKSLIQMVGYQSELESGNINKLMSEASGMMDLYLTMVGSAGATGLASRMGLRGGTGNIAIPARGAALARDLYNKLPNQKLTNVMVEMFEDPKLFALHLQKAKDNKDARDLGVKIAADIGNRFGLRIPRTATSLLVPSDQEPVVDFVKEAAQGETEEQETAPPPQASLPPVPQFMDRESRLQGVEPTPTMSQPPAAPAPAPTGPVNRSQYAALFPSDIASGLIRSQDQGIGSLMG
jgi:hypothetical protein